MPITKETWYSEWPRLPVKAEMLPSDAMRLATPEIASLNRETGSTEIGMLVFETAILSIMEFYGVQWRSSQITELAQMMYSEYYWLQLAELKLFAIKAKKGIYNKKESQKVGDKIVVYDGQIYGELKPMILLKWMECYAYESLREREFNFLNQQTPLSPVAEGEIPEKKKYVDPERVSKAMQEFIAEFKSGHTVTDREDTDYKKEKVKLMQQQASVLEKVSPFQIAAFAARIVGGEKMTKTDDIQFYNNNASEIEMCIKLNYSQNVS